MHGGSAVDASAAPPSSAAVDCLPADKKMTQQAQQQQQQAPPASSDDNDSSNTNTNSRRRLEGKVAIVTSGARGIGEAIARLFVAHGARVVIADVADEAAGQAVASSLGPPERCSYERCDVSVEADVERAVRRAVARHGRLDVLCNNAGVLGRQARGSSSIVDLDAAEFERVVRVNALGAALGMKHAAGAMLMLKAAGEGGGGGGSIVSMASVTSVMGGMGPHAYTASEHALVGLTKNAACELGRHGIRVNCISPFSVATPMLLDAWRDKLQDKDQEDGAAAAESGSGSGSESESESEAATAADEQEEKEVERMEEVVRRLATLKQGATLRASDITEAALFLASDDSRYVSGHNLVVDGGVTTARNLIVL